MYVERLTAMTVATTFLILIAPFALAATLSWAAHRHHSLRFGRNQFHISAPFAGRLSDEDRDIYRIDHDLEAVRTRFEQNPVWPASGATGERR
jgi:hypothetical protein